MMKLRYGLISKRKGEKAKPLINNIELYITSSETLYKTDTLYNAELLTSPIKTIINLKNYCTESSLHDSSLPLLNNVSSILDDQSNLSFSSPRDITNISENLNKKRQDDKEIRL